jgi:hypothetical protein
MSVSGCILKAWIEENNRKRNEELSNAFSSFRGIKKPLKIEMPDRLVVVSCSRPCRNLALVTSQAWWGRPHDVSAEQILHVLHISTIAAGFFWVSLEKKPGRPDVKIEAGAKQICMPK